MFVINCKIFVNIIAIAIHAAAAYDITVIAVCNRCSRHVDHYLNCVEVPFPPPPHLLACHGIHATKDTVRQVLYLRDCSKFAVKQYLFSSYV